jgi:hypothetical protein
LLAKLMLARGLTYEPEQNLTTHRRRVQQWVSALGIRCEATNDDVLSKDFYAAAAI